MEKIITRAEFNSIFNRYHWYNVDENSKQRIFEIFSGLKLSTSEVINILNGAKKMVVASGNVASFEQIKPILDQIKTQQDLKIYNNFDAIDKKLKEYYLQVADLYGQEVNFAKIDLLFANCFKKAQKIASRSNKQVDDFSKEVLDYFWMLASIYAAISQYVPLTDGEILKENFVRIADGLMINAINKLDDKLFVDFKSKLDAMNKRVTNSQEEFELGNNLAFAEIDKLLNALATINIPQGGFSIGESLSENEICDLLLHTKTVVLLSSQEKVFGAIKVLKKHLQKVNAQFKNKFNDIKVKDIFLSAGSILSVKTSSLQDTSALLLGGKVAELHNSKNHKAKNFLKQFFPDMSIQGVMEEEKQHAILQSRRSIFIALNTNSLANATISLVNGLFSSLNLAKTNLETFYDKVVALENLGFNFETIFTADNIFDIFPSSFTTGKVSKFTNENLQENFKQNISLLNKILNISTLQEVVQHNFKLLVESPSNLKQKLAEIYDQYSKTKDYDAYQEDIEKLLNVSIKSNTKKQTGKTTTANTKEQTKKLVKREKTKILLDVAYVDEDLLKEFGLNESLKQSKPKQKAKIVVHPERPNVEDLKHFEDVKIGDDEDEEDEVDTIYDVYYADLGNLTTELIGLQNYLDALILSPNALQVKNVQGVGGTIIDDIIKIDNGNYLTKAAKARQLIRKMENLFNDANLFGEDYREEINNVVAQLSSAIENVDDIISIYEKEKQTVVSSENERLAVLKTMKSTDGKQSSRYIKKMIDGPLNVVVADIEKRFSKAEAEQIKTKYQKQYEDALNLEKEIKKEKDNQENLNNFVVVESRLTVLKQFKKQLTEKLEEINKKLKQMQQEKLNKQKDAVADLLTRKTMLLAKEKDLQSKIDSAKASIGKKQNFLDSRYKEKPTITSPYAARQMKKVEGKQSNIKKLEEELGKVQDDLNSIEQQIAELNSSFED